MPKNYLCTIVSALAIAISVEAHAEMHMTANFGSWSAWEGTGTDQRTPICTSSLSLGDRLLIVKYQLGYGGFLQVSKMSWNIPPSKHITMIMQIDNALPITLEGVATTHDSVQIPLRPLSNGGNQNVVVDTINLLAYGLQVRLSFPYGTEDSWIGPLTGSQAALNVFLDCMSRINRNTQPTQPYSSQPFGHAPKPIPTQPFRGT